MGGFGRNVGNRSSCRQIEEFQQYKTHRNAQLKEVNSLDDSAA